MPERHNQKVATSERRRFICKRGSRIGEVFRSADMRASSNRVRNLVRLRLVAGAAFSALFALSAHGARADVVISSSATSNMSCANGVCAPTATNAVLSASDLETMLASGNVTVTTTGSGVEARNVDIEAAFSWSTANALSVEAFASIAVAQPVSVAGLSGLSLLTNNGGKHGTLSFRKNGSIGFENLASSLTINGTPFALIDSVATLASAVAANPAGNYALANPYDAGSDGVYPDSPVLTTLTGTVNGLGNAISDLTMDITRSGPSNYYGLFTQVGNQNQSEGTIVSIKLARVDIVESAKKLNGGYLGGLVGLNYGTLFNDSVSGKVSTNPEAGGSLAGGVVAANGGQVIDSYSSAHVRAGGGTAGGLVGADGGSIVTSYATGEVNGINAGGLVGGEYGEVENSYASGPVVWSKPQGRVGGLIGALLSNQASISDSYSTGTVTALSGDIGGLVGYYSEGRASNCYWDTTTSGVDQGTGEGNLSGITGLTTQQFQAGLPDGFYHKVWKEKSKTNDGLPYLIANPPAK